MKKMKKLFIIIPFWLFGSLAFAQKKTYSLEDVWQKTLQQYPLLTAKKERISEQEMRKELIKKQFLPEVNIQSQQSYGSFKSVPGSFFPLPGIYTAGGNNKTITNEVGTYLYSSAVLQWNFIQFGRLRKNLDIADASIQLSTQSLKLEEWRLLSVATRSYFSALSSAAFLKIAREDVKRLSDLFSLLQSQSNAGLRPGADTFLIKSALLQSKTKLHEQQAVLKSSVLQLSALIGEDVSPADLDTSIYYRFNQNAITMGDELKHHPYLQLINAQIHYNEVEREAIKKQVYPFIGLLAGVGIKGSALKNDVNVNRNFYSPWSNTSGNYLAGIGLTWNFSSLYQNKTKNSIAGHGIASVKAERDAVQRQLEMQYASAIAAWKEQQQKLADAAASLLSSKQAYELYEVRYQSGLINLIELLQLQKNLQDAESIYAAAISSYWNELINQAENLGNLSLLLVAIQH